MDIESSLKALSLTTDTLTTPCTLEEALVRLVTMTTELMETRQAAVLMRDEARGEFIVRSCVGFEEEAQQRVGHPLQLPDRLKRLLWKIRSVRQIGKVETGIVGLGFPLMVIPLKTKGEIIGLLVTGKPAQPGAPLFGETKRRLLVTIASLASLVIENAKVYDYLNQHFARQSRDLLEDNRRCAGGKNETHQLMATSLSNPTKVVRLLASSFYKELHKTGFTPDQITTAAAEILACITRQKLNE